MLSVSWEGHRTLPGSSGSVSLVEQQIPEALEGITTHILKNLVDCRRALGVTERIWMDTFSGEGGCDAEKSVQAREKERDNGAKGKLSANV